MWELDHEWADRRVGGKTRVAALQTVGQVGSIGFIGDHTSTEAAISAPRPLSLALYQPNSASNRSIMCSAWAR